MVPVAPVSEEPMPSAPSAPPAPEVFLVPEVPAKEKGDDVGGSTAMDVEPEMSATPANGDVAMGSVPVAAEEDTASDMLASS